MKDGAGNEIGRLGFKKDSGDGDPQTKELEILCSGRPSCRTIWSLPARLRGIRKTTFNSPLVDRVGRRVILIRGLRDVMLGIGTRITVLR